jgi:hypothetical protein
MFSPKTSETKHHIHLKPGTVPVKKPLRRFPFAYQEEVKNYLKNMLKDGIIEKIMLCGRAH